MEFSTGTKVKVVGCEVQSFNGQEGVITGQKVEYLLVTLEGKEYPLQFLSQELEVMQPSVSPEDAQ